MHDSLAEANLVQFDRDVPWYAQQIPEPITVALIAYVFPCPNSHHLIRIISINYLL
jgi:hypothetical protein